MLISYHKFLLHSGASCFPAPLHPGSWEETQEEWGKPAGREVMTSSINFTANNCPVENSCSAHPLAVVLINWLIMAHGGGLRDWVRSISIFTRSCRNPTLTESKHKIPLQKRTFHYNFRRNYDLFMILAISVELFLHPFAIWSISRWLSWNVIVKWRRLVIFKFLCFP